MLIAVDSKKPVERMREDLPRACANHKFGVLNVHDLPQKMREKGVAFDRPTLVFDVCNPHQAKRVLEARPEIATVLPCRIAVYALPDGATRIATLRPTAMLGMFGATELGDVACEVEKALTAIIDEAAK